uniref:NADH dehydrogenase subunit 4 n=1 Tax=Ampulex compressa TaxID=860918 RepID=UPI0030033763
MMKLTLIWSSSFIMMNSMKMNKIFIQNMLFSSTIMIITLMNLCLTSMSNIYKYLSMDTLSFMLILLTLWITNLMIMYMKNNSTKNLNFSLIITLLLILFLAFSSTNLFLFYLMFESSMIPTFYIIMFSGMNPERFTASMYMIMYMITSSMPLLVMIFSLMKINTLSFYIIMTMNLKMSPIWFIMTIFAFLVKMPLFGIHMWLPKAHVEAPVYGSMILAAILLKLGTYGIIRMMFIMPYMFKKFSNWIFSISLIGSIIISLMCLTQIDLKMIVAYSSVVHMNMSLCALLTMSMSSMISCFMSMISHGLCSSGLFFMVNLFYMNSNSRSMFINKGLFKLNSSLMILWFILCMNNIGCPPSLNLMSEIMMIFSIISWNKFITPLIFLSCMLSSIYSIFLFIMPHHNNQLNKKFNMFYSTKLINLINIILHTMPLNIMIMNLSLFSMY